MANTPYYTKAEADAKIISGNAGKLSAENINNGKPTIYGDVSTFQTDGNVITGRNVIEDHLTYSRTGTGNTWIYSPEFYPSGNHLIRIKFSIEFMNVNTTAGFKIYVATEKDVTGSYISIADVTQDGEYLFEFDPSYYTVYQGFTKFRVWINNHSIGAGETISAKFTGLSVMEYVGALETSNFGGDNVKQILSSIDSQFINVKNSFSNTAELISSNGSRFELNVSDSGTLSAASVIPNSAVFFGNSLLGGFGDYGMAASAPSKDYYYLITEHIKTLNPSFTSTKVGSSAFEGLTSSASIDSSIQSIFLDNLTGTETLVFIQLGDNVNTPEKRAVFGESSLKLCQQIRAHCPNARVFWIGMWYGDSQKYTDIENACLSTGCKFITIADLIDDASRSAIGNITKRGSAQRTLSGVTNVTANTATNITVNFTVSSTSYTSTLDVTSYSLSGDVLTYTGDYEIISSAGVASHPNDEGFRRIANRFIFQSKLSFNQEVYV